MTPADAQRSNLHPREVALLRSPLAYPTSPVAVEVIETHMSWVFLAENSAYKLKKPVKNAYLDFTTPAARRRDCEEEVRLNRRLAPDVYRGVLPLTRDEGGELHLGGAGEPVDWVVAMRRLPGHRMLDELIRAGRLTGADVCHVARRLARFYVEADRVHLSAAGYRDKLLAALEDTREVLARPRYDLRGDLVEALARAQRELIDRAGRLLAARADGDHIVEGHGDLRPEHICVEREPVVIDCVEFCRDLRVVDAASELCFLSLECERLGAAYVGGVLFDAYAGATGDRPSPLLLRLYRASHAYARAKLAAWHLDEANLADPSRWLRRARAYLDIAAETLGIMPRRAR